MKKIFYICACMCVMFGPMYLTAQTSSSSACTGEIRTDMVAAQDCVNKAETEGAALGYEISCEVEQLGLGGFTDPTSGKDYILNPVCTVNGSEGHGAYLLAGFTASAGSNAIIQNVNPGWNILKTELGYESAVSQCGGQAPYYINGSYTCTAPPGALPLTTPPSGTTKVSNTNSLTPDGAGQNIYKEIFRLNQQLTKLILGQYDTYAQTMLSSGSSTDGDSSNASCYVFAKTLKFGDSGADVYALTYALKKENFLTALTVNFDTTVMTAVKRFQEAHSTEILSILGLTQGTGLVGDKTREYLNTNCLAPASLVIPANPVNPTPPTGQSCPAVVRSGIKDGKYQYTFSKNSNNTWTITLNNPAYSVDSDQYYVPAKFAFIASNALDLNRQNQGKFNYLQALPGTASGNTEYANLFGSFNNAYYDWDNMTKNATSTCVTATTPPPTSVVSTASYDQARYIRVSVADWDTLPLGIREITVLTKNNSVVRPASIDATDFDVMGYQPPVNVLDNNENTIWRATKTSGQDLQVLTLDMGKITTFERVKIINYSPTDTRVFVVEVSLDGNTYRQIAEVRAQESAPIADKGVVWGIMSASSTVGPIQY